MYAVRPDMSRCVAALVVSYNTAETTLDCLAALGRSRDVTLRVLVYDNASRDGSADAIQAALPDAILVRGGENLGFGRASNVLSEMTDGCDVLLVNSDCIVGETTIADCVAFLDAQPGASAVACQLRNRDGSVQNSCRAFPSIWGEVSRVVLPYQFLRHMPGLGAYYMGGWSHNETRPVPQPSGAFLLVRGGAWGPGPLFDERFFMYYEDVDLCRRLWRHGPVWFYAGTTAVHLGEQSSSRVRPVMASALALSRHRYFEKWHGRVAALFVDTVGGLASTTRWLVWSTVGRVFRASDNGKRASAHRAAAGSAFSEARRRTRD
jgi:GT2 family glycosyltransferase